MRSDIDSMNDQLFIKKIYKILDEKPFEEHTDEENSTSENEKKNSRESLKKKKEELL